VEYYTVASNACEIYSATLMFRDQYKQHLLMTLLTQW